MEAASYSLSKPVEIIISVAFNSDTIINTRDLCSTIRNVINIINVKLDAEHNLNETISALDEIASRLKPTSIISRNQLLKVADGIAKREWVDRIILFHIITAIATITKHTGKHIENYVNSEIMFSPLLTEYLSQGSIVQVALTKPTWNNTDITKKIATSISTYDNVALIGEQGVGKKSAVISFIKEVALGNYPLLYNSKFLLNPTRSQLENTISTQNGSHIISIMTDCTKGGDIASSSLGLTDSSALSRRAKFIFIMTGTKNAVYQAYKEGVLNIHLIRVNSPNTSECIEILKSHSLHMRRYIDFDIEDNALKMIAEAADKFESSEPQPTKSINLMIGAVFNKLNTISSESEHINSPISIEHTTNEQNKAICEKLERNTAYRIISITAAHVHVSIKDVESFVVKKYNLTPEVLATMLSIGSREHLSSVKNKMLEHIFGQDEIVDDVVKSMKRRAIRLDPMERPISYLLVGRTGLGKTWLCKVMAMVTLGSQSKMVRFDMSEYKEAHEVSKLIGSPPGYVGSNQPGRLTDEVAKNPNCILLLDEVEKAHSSILDIFLQVLDDGILTDNHGKTVDFSRATVVMTSNIGTKGGSAETNTAKIGFGEGRGNRESSKQNKEYVLKEVEDYFRPEFINRIGKIIVFNELNDKHFKKIILTRLKEIRENCTINIEFDEDTIADAILHIAKEKPYNISKYNAREVKRAVVEQFENKLVDAYDKYGKDGIYIRVRQDAGRPRIEAAPPKIEDKSLYEEHKI